MNSTYQIIVGLHNTHYKDEIITITKNNTVD